MAESLPPLLGVHAFEASARHLSFVAAGRELHLSPSAISQRVRILEAHLGVQLFVRRARSLRLTAAGESYLPAVREALQELSSVTTGIFGRADRSSLTVRAQTSYATTWLAPRLPGFAREFPHIEVRLLTAVWSTVPHPARVDLEIRQGDGSWPGYRVVKLHDDHAVAVCGAEFAARNGVPELRAVAELPRVQILGFETLWRHVFAGADADPALAMGPPATMTVDTAVTALEVIAAGSMWGIVPERFARAGVRAARVVPIPGSLVAMRQSHFVLRRDTAEHVSGESLAFERWLRAQDAEDRTVL